MRLFLLFPAIVACGFCGIAAVAPPAQQLASSPAPPYNPLRAHHDVDVGKFYLHSGDYPGAIARFKDAILYDEHFAEPRLLLGQAYEKNGDPGRAIRYYQEYLKILPESPDSKKIRERVAKLKEKIKKDAAASAKN